MSKDHSVQPEPGRQENIRLSNIRHEETLIHSMLQLQAQNHIMDNNMESDTKIRQQAREEET